MALRFFAPPKVATGSPNERCLDRSLERALMGSAREPAGYYLPFDFFLFLGFGDADFAAFGLAFFICSPRGGPVVLNHLAVG